MNETFYVIFKHRDFQVQFSNALILQCLKIAQKVAFNNVSEVSYVYFSSGQKFI